MKTLRFLIPSLVMIGLVSSSSMYAQFDDVYYDPKKDALPETYTRVDNYKENNSNNRYENSNSSNGTYNTSGGYEGNNTINSGYDNESYEYQDGYDEGYEDGYYTSRINRFHRYNGGFGGMYDPWSFNSFGYNDWMFRPSVTFGYDPFFNYNRFYRSNSWWGYGPYGNSFGFGGYGWGNPYGYGGWGNPYGGWGGYGDPYWGNGFNNGWYGGYPGYGFGNNAPNRVYGARNGGAVVGSKSGYRDRGEIRSDNNGSSRDRQGSSTPRNTVEPRNTQPNSRDRSTPSRTTTPRQERPQTQERQRSTPQRETSPRREQPSTPRSNDGGSRTRSERSDNSSFSSPSRSSSPSSSGSGSSGSSGRSSSGSSGSSGRTGRG